MLGLLSSFLASFLVNLALGWIKERRAESALREAGRLEADNSALSKRAEAAKQAADVAHEIDRDSFSDAVDKL